jgi:hypothetical protein
MTAASLEAEGSLSPLILTVHRRTSSPRLLVTVETTHTGYEVIYAQDLPDVMDLIAKWPPAIQAVAVTALLDGINQPGGACTSNTATPVRTLMTRDVSSI